MEPTLREKIVKIIGFGIEPERAELMAIQIETLFIEESIKIANATQKTNMQLIDDVFKNMGL